MNLRTLKKLSKRAAPLLPLLGDNRKQFKAERWDNYTGMIIRDRKHWERGRSVHADVSGENMIKYQPEGKDYWIYLKSPVHPRKGTVMVGAVSGYYEPEWDEETAWEALRGLVWSHFTDWSGETPRPSRRLRTASDFLRAAHDMAAARRACVRDRSGAAGKTGTGLIEDESPSDAQTPSPQS